ncbi:MAG: NAD+ synthase [Campylobacterales bacterium]
MRIGIIQGNYTVGDIEGNSNKIAALARECAKEGAQLAITSELALTGYPPRDLLFYRAFIDRVEERLIWLAKVTADLSMALLVGFVERVDENGHPVLYNSAAWLEGGEVRRAIRKTLLPNYDVFDEMRYFHPNDRFEVIAYGGERVAVTICEDIWNDPDFHEYPRYPINPVEEFVSLKPTIMVNLSASPMSLGKEEQRRAMVASLSSKYRLPIVYVNQVGGNDDLVFDGRSFITGCNGELLYEAPAYHEGAAVVELSKLTLIEPHRPPRAQEAWEALVCGTRDYIKKCGFTRALVGLSGGIDSALVAAIACEALGADNFKGILMPSPWSSQGSIDDALALAKNLGFATITLPIAPIMDAFDATLAELFHGRERDVTEENIQARIRGNLLMAISNKEGSMLLSTGNKSELSVGYCTIYGDMSGGFAVLADVPKMLVYEICRWLNESRGREIIPKAIIEKEPSAELRPGQKDSDSLPPYELLDEILRLHIEEHYDGDAIIRLGYDEATVRRIIRLVANAEFKRKQAAPGLKITERAFGSGWRMPIAARKLL